MVSHTQPPSAQQTKGSMLVAKKGLSLIELMVALTIVALLIAILLPTLVSVRNQAQAAACIQNQRTLSVAWLMYKDDNDDKLVGGHVGARPHDWVQGPTGPGDIITRKIQGIREGALFQFTGETDAYRCPSDRRQSNVGPIAFRSYSIAGGADGEGWQNSYVQAKKYSDIIRPAEKYVFVEEADQRGWNMGSWVMNVKDESWVDPVAIWHARARSTLGFADGHANVREWIDSSTIEMAQKQEFFHPVPEGEGQDLRYILAGFPRKTLDSIPP